MAGEEDITDIIKISAGNKAGAAAKRDGTGYTWGDNTNKKIGVEDTKARYATEITKVQTRLGEELTLRKIENVEVGETHSAISDESGFVYTVRTKYKGRTRYTRQY